MFPVCGGIWERERKVIQLAVAESHMEKLKIRLDGSRPRNSKS